MLGQRQGRWSNIEPTSMCLPGQVSCDSRDVWRFVCITLIRTFYVRTLTETSVKNIKVHTSSLYQFIARVVGGSML